MAFFLSLAACRPSSPTWRAWPLDIALLAQVRPPAPSSSAVWHLSSWHDPCRLACRVPLREGSSCLILYLPLSKYSNMESPVTIIERLGNASRRAGASRPVCRIHYNTPGCHTGGGMGWHRYVHNYVQGQERADSWHDFHSSFMALAHEEQGRADVITKGETLRRMDRVLRAYCNYEKHPEGWERGKPGQGMICLFDTPPHGVWSYSDGISENFLERVRLCIAEAGWALPDFAEGVAPEDFWLHQLYLDSLKNNSDLLFCASKEGGTILSVCVASGTFCARLERQALSYAERGTKTTVAPNQEETSNLMRIP